VGLGLDYGAIRAATRSLRDQGYKVAQAHLRHLNPFPANLGDVVAAYPKVLVPELNLAS